MQITLTPDQEAQLADIASMQGKGPDELAYEVLSRGLSEEARFLEAVRIGQEAADRGDVVDSARVWEEIEKALL
jgi:hypothetical protein